MRFFRSVSGVVVSFVASSGDDASDCLAVGLGDVAAPPAGGLGTLASH